MKITDALKFIGILASQIEKANQQGRESIDLMEEAKSLDDDARQALVDAIAKVGD